MRGFFTDMGMEQMRQLQARGIEKRKDLSTLLGVLTDVTRSADPEQVAGTVRVADGPSGEVFVIRGGNLRALLVADPSTDSLVVASVYEAGEDEGAQLGNAINDVVELGGIQ